MGLMVLLALAASTAGGSAAPLGPLPPPCAACVTFRASPAVASTWLDAPGTLAGLDVIVAAGGSVAVEEVADVARRLAARGATVRLELSLEAGLADAVPPGVRGVVFVLPAAETAGDSLVFRIRTAATALKASHPAAEIALAGAPDLLAALDARGIAPYVGALVATTAEGVPASTASGLEWWTPALPGSVTDVLEATRRAAGARVVVPLRAEDAKVARTVAHLADALPGGLSPLPAVSLCKAHGECAPVFLHPATVEAIAVVPAAAFRMRPGALAAVARPLDGGPDRTLSITREGDAAAIDTRAMGGASVLRVSGWAGGEAGFTASVEVGAARALTAAEIVAAHQAAAARQSARLHALVATGSTVLTFQVPGLAAPMTVTAETVLYRGGGVTDIEQRDLRLNGVDVAIGEDGVPRLPLVQPEKVASAPLSITLGDQYRYRLAGEERHEGRRCYLVAFRPARDDRSSFEGRAWIDTASFSLVRLQATQTRLRGAIVSSRQDDRLGPLRVGGMDVWVVVQSDVEQVYEGPAHRTPIRRQVTFETLEANPADFEARLAAAHRSRAVMMRETADGFRYLRRPAPARGEEPVPGAASASAAARTLAGSASRVWSVAAGSLFDPNIDRPLPFAGLSYLDFDVLGTGAQMSAFLAGPFLQAAVAVPSVGGPGLQVHASLFASLTRYNDRSFRGGRERYDENLRQRPMRASVAFLRRLGGRTRVRLAYDLDALRLEPNDTTAPDFGLPDSPVAHALRLGLEWERGAWSATAWGSSARRQRWSSWGRPGDFSGRERAYERAGITLARSLVLSPGVVARVDAGVLAGRHLDRFSRFGFDAFDNRLRGYPSAGVRFDRGAVLRTSATWTLRRGLRLDGFLDGALVRDPMEGPGAQTHAGAGAAIETALPGRVLLTVDWGYGFRARDKEGRHGTHVVRVTALKVL